MRQLTVIKIILLVSGLQLGNLPFLVGQNNNVGIGTMNPEPSALLEVKSTEKGFLPPRMTSEQRDDISNPAEGLVIFNTTTGCLDYYYSGEWYEKCGNLVGRIASLACSMANHTGTLTQGVPASGVSSTIPYTGGNGGFHHGQVVTSTGVNGLTATLLPGNFNNGSGSLLYSITGIPTSSGTAQFMLQIGSQTCILERTVVPPSQYPPGTVHCMVTPTSIVEVINPATGKIWMDKNLGASQVATSSTDPLSYGDLYQWGRFSDGHQCRNSGTTPTLSNDDQPGHDDFITVNAGLNDWRSPQNNNLWQVVSGINNPCPQGFRLPTQAEFDEERLSWSSQTPAGAFASPLKIPLPGIREHGAGTIYIVGEYGIYWTSTIAGTNAVNLRIQPGSAIMFTDPRAYGMSVRCIKN